MIITPKETGGLIRFGALWTWERLDKNGNVISVERASNLVPTEGKNYFLDVALHGSTQISPFYVVLWTPDYTPLITNTYAVPGFTEFQSYNEANRPEFVESAAAAGIISNSGSRAIFTITVEDTIYGSGLVGGGTNPSVKADVASGGTLLSSVRMTTPQVYSIGEVVRVTVIFTVA